MRRALLVTAALLLCSSARAYTLTPSKYSGREITNLGKGLKELGFDNVLLLKYDKPEGQDGELTASYLGGFTFRYFIIDNTALTLQLQGLYAKEAGDISTAGFFGTLGAAYYVGLGHGVFLSPSLAAGAFAGSRDTVVSQDGAGTTLIESKSTYGGLARVKFGLVYYAGPKFNLHAGPEFVFQFGTVDSDEGNLSTFTTEGGFNVGASYVF